MQRQTRWVLFDLGGVLVELGGVQDFGSLIGERDEDEIWRVWLHCEWVQRYERGECTSEVFARSMVEHFAMSIDSEEFMRRFRSWPRGLLPRAREAVDGLHPELGRACLSNTNALHWSECMQRLGLGELFPTRFLSHEMGAVKPEARAFALVVERLGVEPEQILFLDDTTINVEAGRQAGLDAQRVRGAQEAIALLHARGLYADD